MSDNLLLRGPSIEAARASIGDLNATLGGNFRVAKIENKPVVLLGAVNTVRGTYAYQGRRFRHPAGTVRSCSAVTRKSTRG